MAANIGSAATITGNPQNMMIGSFSGIPYRYFLASLAPVAILRLVLAVIVIFVAYRRQFQTPEGIWVAETGGESGSVADVEVARGFPRHDRDVFRRRVRAQGCDCGWRGVADHPPVEPDKVYRKIDWPLLVMFAGLFIIIAGIKKTPLVQNLAAVAGRLHLDNAFLLSGIAALLSNLVSNVPAVLVFKPFIPHLADPQRAWLVLAMSSTLAGNLTVVGSVANLIVLQRARHKVRIGFWEYSRVGAPLAVLTNLAGATSMAWR
jgi:Na+/H+ antiporter NhaD/arsenite permease-like protein